MKRVSSMRPVTCKHRLAPAVRAMDILHSAQQHIARQFRQDMERLEALSHFEARATIWNCQQQFLRELGFPITVEEFNARVAQQKSASKGHS